MTYSILDYGKTRAGTCKPPFSEQELRSQYHDIRDENFWRILPEVYDFTQLSMDSMVSLYDAVRYLVQKDVRGDLVECGVLLGGSMMLIAKTLLSLDCSDRQLWLYDSFAGFVGRKTETDVDWTGKRVEGLLPDFYEMAIDNMKSTGYPIENCIFRKGDIEQLAPVNENGAIALLRLDTDTYYSTKAELECFFPKLAAGGVLIIDDYGHALGSRRATDEYLADPRNLVLLHRVNFANRIGIKTS